MKTRILVITLLFCWFGYSQTKSLNADSLKWEKDNPNWERELFQNPEFVNKLEISKRDRRMELYQSMTRECRIFGYEKPDTNSKKLLLLSIWTFDVKDNPSDCTFGSYYDTVFMNGMDLKYLETKDKYIKAELLKENKPIAILYFEKKWVEFADE